MSRNPLCTVFGLGLRVARRLSQWTVAALVGRSSEVASDDDQEKSLEAALRKANNRRAKVGLYLSDWNNRITALAFVVLSISTGVTVGLWVAQRAANNINNATYIASTRPWIMLTDTKPTALTSDNEDGVGLWAEFAVKNVGHSPAQNVSVSAKLFIRDFDPFDDQGIVSACKEGQTGSWVIPGPPVFPDQTREIGVDPLVTADRVWAARAARIKSTYDNKLAFGGNPERAKEWADAIAKFPFYAPLSLVGCINYRSPDDRTLYQTSFIYDVDTQGTTFPLLSEKNPVSLPPTPMPSDPGGVVVHPREVQRIVPGEKVKLKPILYGVIAH